MAQVAGHGLAHVDRQRKTFGTVGFTADDDFSGAPVHILQLQGRNLAGSQPEANQHGQDREVPSADFGAPIAGCE